MNLQETIKRILKGVAKKLSNKLHCDRHGSCVHFAELFVEEINNTHPELLKEFDVIEGYVDVKFGEGKPQEHTWIRLSNDEVIDPTFMQFTKYDKNAKYSRKRTKSYTGQEYYDEGVKGSWFSKRRKEQPDTVFKGRLQENIHRIKEMMGLNESNIERGLQIIIDSSLQKLQDDIFEMGLGELDELNEINSVDEIKITNFVKDKVSVLHVDLYVNSDREDFDNIIYTMEYELEKYIGNIEIIVDNIIDTR
jgi:hypothetical protein